MHALVNSLQRLVSLLLSVRVVLLIAFAGCGRIGFEVIGSSAGDDDASIPPVSGGGFSRSYDVAADGMYADASFTATVSPFSLDKYEVTVARFRAFIMSGAGTQANPPIAGSGAHPNIAGAGWDPAWNAGLPNDTAASISLRSCDAAYQTWTNTPGANEDKPINCVNWYEAMAFCAWDGGFVPTEAEWNFAASGGDEQRAYPWSSPPGSLLIDATHASFRVGGDCVGDGMPGCAATDVLSVGSRPAGDGRWGHSDLGGSMHEWALDWYVTPYPQVPCDDCANLAQGMAIYRAVRGGGFANFETVLRTGSRYYYVPVTRVGDIGLRCARSSP